MRNSDLPPIVTTERENQEDIEFMDTPIITQYYKEHDPMKRKELLEQSHCSRRVSRGESDPQGTMGDPLCRAIQSRQGESCRRFPFTVDGHGIQ